MPKLSKRQIEGLGQRLVEFRNAAGLSQQVCATRAGISIPRLRDAECFNAATTETLNLVSKVLGVTVDQLCGR